MRNPDLEMYFTVNLAFVDYLEQLNETITTPNNRNWTSAKTVNSHFFRLLFR